MISNCVDRTAWEYILLRKCFTQGNALTFPVQSISYAMAAIAAVIIADEAAVTAKTVEDASKRVRVFGDDIIVPNSSLVTLVKILTALQLRVNSSKTFSNGKFRESCGVDAYDGVNVTPVYVKTVSTKPRHEQAVSAIESAINLFKAGMWNVAEWLRNTVRHYQLPILHVRENGLGWSSFSGRDESHLQKRWNAGLQRYEIRTFALTDNSEKHDQPGAYKLFDFFVRSARAKASSFILSQINEGTDGLVIGRRSSVMRRVWHTSYS
jgi:hypothetical protein